MPLAIPVVATGITSKLIYFPSSELVSTYVIPVAPTISVLLSPDELSALYHL